MSISICSYMLMYGENIFDRVAASIGQSEIMRALNKQWAQQLTLSDEPASQEFQDLWLDAQRAIGVPESARVPIRMININEEGNFIRRDLHQIGVNFKELPDNTDFYKRHLMLREAVHVKYNHELYFRMLRSNILVPVASLVIAFVAVKFCRDTYVDRYLKQNLKRGYLLMPLACTVVTCLLVNKLCDSLELNNRYLKYAERIADTQALLANGCPSCVNAYADRLSKVDKQACHGYLSSEQVKELAKTLQQQSVCSEHKGNERR